MSAPPLPKPPPTSTGPMPSTSTGPMPGSSFVLGESDEMPPSTPVCKGYDFDENGVDLPMMMTAMMSTGFQATNLARCVTEINRMRAWRLSDVPVKDTDDEELKDMEVRRKVRARIFFSYTSNQISCGQREIIKYVRVAQHRRLHGIVGVGEVYEKNTASFCS